MATQMPSQQGHRKGSFNSGQNQGTFYVWQQHGVNSPFSIQRVELLLAISRGHPKFSSATGHKSSALTYPRDEALRKFNLVLGCNFNTVTVTQCLPTPNLQQPYLSKRSPKPMGTSIFPNQPHCTWSQQLNCTLFTRAISGMRVGAYCK